MLSKAALANARAVWLGARHGPSLQVPKFFGSFFKKRSPLSRTSGLSHE